MGVSVWFSCTGSFNVAVNDSRLPVYSDEINKINCNLARTNINVDALYSLASKVPVFERMALLRVL